MSNVAKAPLHERPSDYVFNMTTLNSGEARRLWRAAIKEAWSNRCAYCGATPIEDQSLTIDHVKPRSKGGQDCTSNVIPACRSCNQEKGSDEWIAWFRMQPFYTISAELRIREWLKTGEVPAQESSMADVLWYDRILTEAA
ncbi:HNH endonuclease [Synechococcus phage S-CRES2]|nr:HNH endonuclease [Synechococcus phage S-CRES1]WGL30619.1 HNH endonuclease [Synechococcus phage S-CRES2]